MRKFLSVLAFGCLIATGAHADDARPPAWAFANNPPPDQSPAAPHDDGQPRQVPNSDVALTLSQVKDAFNIPDWHPENHPPAPEIVVHGKRPTVMGCGYCHLPNGQGRPENAGVAGLPAAYIIQQLADFKSGARRSSDPKLVPPSLMDNIAAAATDEEVKQAADYFSALKFKPWIRVVETATVPKTRVSGYMLVAIDGAGTEPIGTRIVETPENLAQTELRDSGSGFIAYVPIRSIKKGEALVTTGGNGKTTQCGICHGPDLKGLGPVPPLAGRSPSSLFRQLYDIRGGARAGTWTPLMKGVLAKLGDEDLVSIVAYVASRSP